MADESEARRSFVPEQAVTYLQVSKATYDNWLTRDMLAHYEIPAEGGRHTLQADLDAPRSRRGGKVATDGSGIHRTGERGSTP